MTVNENNLITLEEATTVIENRANDIVDRSLEKFYAMFPSLQEKYGPKGVALCRQDCHYHLEFLVAAIRNQSPHSFAEYIGWVMSVLRARGGYESLSVMLELMGQDMRQQLGEAVWHYVAPPLDAALTTLQDDRLEHQLYIIPPADALMKGYLRAILSGNRLIARELILDAFRAGMPIRQIYLHVFQPALYEVGQGWEQGKLSVAQEHLATAVTQTILSAIYAEADFPPSRGETALVACLSENYHEIGARMVADFLQFEGYNTLYLGANTPEDSVLNMIDELKPSVIGLPSTLGYQVEPVRQTIQKIRVDFRSYRPTILVGGIAFNLVEDLWRQVGGDVWGPDAGQAIDNLIGSAS